MNQDQRCSTTESMSTAQMSPSPTENTDAHDVAETIMSPALASSHERQKQPQAHSSLVLGRNSLRLQPRGTGSLTSAALMPPSSAMPATQSVLGHHHAALHNIASPHKAATTTRIGSLRKSLTANGPTSNPLQVLSATPQIMSTDRATDVQIKLEGEGMKVMAEVNHQSRVVTAKPEAGFNDPSTLRTYKLDVDMNGISVPGTHGAISHWTSPQIQKIDVNVLGLTGTKTTAARFNGNMQSAVNGAFGGSIEVKTSSQCAYEPRLIR